MKTIVIPEKKIKGFLKQLEKTKKMSYTVKGDKFTFYLTPREVRVLDTMYPGILPPEEVEKVDLFGNKELRITVNVEAY